MAKDDVIKLPRLYVDHELAAGIDVPLSAAQAHYLRTVLRRHAGDGLRLFNGRGGEWLAALATPDRKTAQAAVREKLREQPAARGATYLLFAPLKKDAMDFLVEKAVELGVTHLQPVLTQNTEVRRINEERLRAQIAEAAEQCERLTIPELASPDNLMDILARAGKAYKLFACVERNATAAPLPKDFPENTAFLIGPEGGFTVEEREKIAALPYVIPCNLGDTILRAETAALFCLAARRLTS